MKHRVSLVALILLGLAALILFPKRVKEPPVAPAPATDAAVEQTATQTTPASSIEATPPARTGPPPAQTPGPVNRPPATATPANPAANAQPGAGKAAPGARPSTGPTGAPGTGATFLKAEPQPLNPQAEADIDRVRMMLRDYRTLMGENPVGTNAEITKALMGGNPKQAQLGPPDGQGLNEFGELVDRWGTPYFFHQLSKDLMEIRSAGPDKVMWTSDDVVTK